MGLWTLAGSWSADNLTDGFVPVHVLVRWDKHWKRLAASLVAADLWKASEREGETGYQFISEPVDEDILARRLWKFAHRRESIAEPLRQKIYMRDGFICCDCGTSDDLTLDHIYPWSLGGSDSETNLRTLCRSCNSRKGARV